MKSVKIPWYQKPMLGNNKYLNVQKGAMFAALFSLVSVPLFLRNIKMRVILNFILTSVILQFVGLFTMFTALFDLYCLSMAAPGAVHYGYYFISYEFVYVGNRHGK